MSVKESSASLSEKLQEIARQEMKGNARKFQEGYSPLTVLLRRIDLVLFSSLCSFWIVVWISLYETKAGSILWVDDDKVLFICLPYLEVLPENQSNVWKTHFARHRLLKTKRVKIWGIPDPFYSVVMP
jgi:hypothetical protein